MGLRVFELLCKSIPPKVLQIRESWLNLLTLPQNCLKIVLMYGRDLVPWLAATSAPPQRPFAGTSSIIWGFWLLDSSGLKIDQKADRKTLGRFRCEAHSIRRAVADFWSSNSLFCWIFWLMGSSFRHAFRISLMPRRLTLRKSIHASHISLASAAAAAAAMVAYKNGIKLGNLNGQKTLTPPPPPPFSFRNGRASIGGDER